MFDVVESKMCSTILQTASKTTLPSSENLIESGLKFKPILEKYKDTNRVFMMDHSKYNAKELKGFISRCRLFIGARTHSTIAAYSTGVPTLALGYSIKARGIAKDLFGKIEGHVVPVDTIKKDTDLIAPFDNLLKNEVELRIHLSKMMQGYKNAAHQAATRIEDIVNE